jgi:acyl carrier protein
VTTSSETISADTIRQLVVQAVGPEPMNGVSDDEPLFERYILDSLSLVSIMTTFEEHFGISVTPGDLVPANFRTINDMARFVSAKRATR